MLYLILTMIIPPVLSMFAVFLSGLTFKLIPVALVVSVLSSLLLFFLGEIVYTNTFGKRHKKFISFCNADFTNPLHFKHVTAFNNKYNFKKIQKALENHDFQSPDLSLFIKHHFNFNQEDLNTLENKDILGLYEKVKSNEKLAKKILKAVKKKKPIRKINAVNFLKKYNKHKNKIANSLAIDLQGITGSNDHIKRESEIKHMLRNLEVKHDII